MNILVRQALELARQTAAMAPMPHARVAPLLLLLPRAARAALEAAIWPTLTAGKTDPTATLKAAVDAAAVAAGYTLGSS